jgi:hypothetical protein
VLTSGQIPVSWNVLPSSLVYVFLSPHGVITQKINIDIFAMKTSNLVGQPVSHSASQSVSQFVFIVYLMMLSVAHTI